MAKRFEDRIFEERKRLRVTTEELSSRIKVSPYGPKTKKLLERWIQCESNGEVGFALYSCPPVMERGSGAIIVDTDGKEYIDLISGFSVNNVGLCNREVVEAIKEQAGKLIQYFDLPTPPRIQLSEKVIEITPGDFPKKVIYSVTGSEIMEAAMKLARWYTGKPFILVPYGDYHGRTTGAQALTGKGGMWAYHYPIPPADTGIFYFPYAYCYRCGYDKEYPGCDLYCVKALEDLFESKEAPFRDPKADVSNVAAIIIEPMQSSAGYIIPPTAYLSRLQELCDKYDILLVVDEIQTGMGRTGKMWACEHSKVAPDLMAIAKSIAGGLPLSVLVGRKEIMDSWGPAAHLGTFAGTPLACAAANKVLEIMGRDRLAEKAAEKGKYFLAGLSDLAEKHPIIGQVDGIGLYLSVEFIKDKKTKEPASEEAGFMMSQCIKEGLICEHSGYYYNRFSLIPTLVISRQEINRVLEILDLVLGRAETKFGIG